VRPPRIGAIEWLAWAVGVASIIAMIGAAGQLCFGRYAAAAGLGAFAAAGVVVVVRLVRRIEWA
jgi:hypothetical protein